MNKKQKDLIFLILAVIFAFILVYLLKRIAIYLLVAIIAGYLYYRYKEGGKDQE